MKTEAAGPVRVMIVNLLSLDYPALALPLALPTLGGTLQSLCAGTCEVYYFDRQVSSLQDFSERIRSVRPHLVALSAQFGSAQDLVACLDVLTEVASDATCVVGNVLGTYAAEELARNHPGLLCCSGRGEETLTKLVEWIHNADSEGVPLHIPNLVFMDSAARLHATPSRALTEEYLAPADFRGFSTAYPRVQYEEYWVEGSRGCPQKRNNVGCTYCAILPEAGNRDWSPRPMDLVITDVTELASLGVTHVRFADEEFMANQPARALEFASAYRELRHDLRDHAAPTFDVAMRVDDVTRTNPAQDRPRPYSLDQATIVCSPNEMRKRALVELRNVGLNQVYLGVESGSASQLRRMKKGVTPLGNEAALERLSTLRIQAACGWIMFDPLMESVGDLMENVEFIERNNLLPEDLGDNFVTNPINTMRVLVGTPLLEQVAEAGLLGDLRGNLLEYDFEYANPAIGALVRRIEEWARGLDRAKYYAAKTRVAHAALTRAERSSSSDAFFRLKRLDFEVCRWLIAETLRNLDVGGSRKCRAVPRRFHETRARIAAGL